MRLLLLLAILASATQAVFAQKFDIITSAGSVSIVYASDGRKLDSIIAHLLANDIEAVTDVRPVVTNNLEKVSGNAIIIGAINSRLIQSLKDNYFKQLEGKWESYSHKLVKQPFKNIPYALVIAGSDTRGTTYGVFSLSEKIGVSPWYWWADVHPKKKKLLSLNITPFTSLPPSVKFRGIFINDEDWGLQPWAAKTFEPETGDIGPKTYAKVFELLLRLKANLIWPAMHESTKAFYHYPGNPKVAEDYQIMIGSSHAEPMLRNNVDEWDVKTMGRFNYLTNKERILQYWEERIKESRGVDAIYTIGMRGVHDGQMEGVKDLKEAVPIVERIIQDERNLFAKHLNKDVTQVPQVLTPYKEVLEIYDNGLKVPNDVTLVWPDDNYGYIQRLSNEQEKKRSGGAGVYYHASYWGRPHDYLWLPSLHPSLMREEMLKAYQTGANRMWVLNVGDIKSIEYNMQEFLDMAYNVRLFEESNYSKQHMLQWATSIFGKEQGAKIQSVLWDYFDLAFERRPEFMAWSQVEPITKTSYTAYNHFYYGDEAQRRIDKYNALENTIDALLKKTDTTTAAAFYQLVYYPVVGAAEINKKFLYRDKAYLYTKQARISAFDYAALSNEAYHRIEKETEFLNSLQNGKWRSVMSMKPRDLPVFQAPVLPSIQIASNNSWNIAPEGFDTSAMNDFVLPHFTNDLKQSYFIDVFLSDSTTVQWKASPSANWITLSAQSGVLCPEQNKNQIRLWVSVDWSKVPASEQLNGQIHFSGGEKQYTVNVRAFRPQASELRDFKGFVESNGYVSLYAQHYTDIKNKSNYNWETVNGLGHTGASMRTAVSLLPVKSLDTNVIKQTSSCLTYNFFTFSDAAPQVAIYALPTLPLNKAYRMRCAVSIDEWPLQIIDFTSNSTARTEEWKQNVLSNTALRKVASSYLKKGKHTLKVFAIDPGVVLDRIVIDLGGMKNAFSPIEETTTKTNVQQAN